MSGDFTTLVATQLPGRPAKTASGPSRRGLDSGEEDEVLGLLQQITRAGNDWRPTIVALATKHDAATIDACQATLRRVRPLVDKYLSRADEIIESDALVRRWCGDVLTHIRLQWDAVDADCAALEAAADAAGVASRSMAAVDECAFVACRLTIPPRLHDLLDNMAIGDEINFDEWYQDELPDEARRTELLEELDVQSLLVNASVDVAGRRIVKAGATFASRWVGLAAAVLLVVASAASLVVLRNWNGAPGLPTVANRPTRSVVVGDSLLIWAGMVLHIAVAGYRRMQDRRAPRSARRLLTMVSARQTTLWTGVLVGAALSYIFVVSGRVTDGLAVLAVGYSSDSLMGALLPSFDAQMTKLEKALPITA